MNEVKYVQFLSQKETKQKKSQDLMNKYFFLTKKLNFDKNIEQNIYQDVRSTYIA